VLTVNVITEESDLPALKHEWQELFTHATHKSVPLSYYWNYTWWHQYGSQRGPLPGGLRVFLFREGGTLVGILPLFLEYPSRTLRFISSGGPPGDSVFPEFVDILALPHRTEECLSAFCAALSQPPILTEWRELECTFSKHGSAIESYFRIQVNIIPPLWKKERVLLSPYATLEGGFEKYLSNLGNSQKYFRRILRQSERLNLSFRVANDEKEIMTTLENLFRLHQQTWQKRGEPGAFHTETVKEFHRAVAKQLHEHGMLFLAELVESDKTIAVVYGFLLNGKFELYQTGIVEIKDTQLKSPGIAIHLYAMHYLAERQVYIYDFLGGEAEYKRRFANGHSTLVERRLIRITGKVLIIEGLKRFKTFLKKMLAR
jgi:CelD/BcsL family acetyltransferase involved in cellulose biosynthesis